MAAAEAVADMAIWSIGGKIIGNTSGMPINSDTCCCGTCNGICLENTVPSSIRVQVSGVVMSVTNSGVDCSGIDPAIVIPINTTEYELTPTGACEWGVQVPITWTCPDESSLPSTVSYYIQLFALFDTVGFTVGVRIWAEPPAPSPQYSIAGANFKETISGPIDCTLALPNSLSQDFYNSGELVLCVGLLGDCTLSIDFSAATCSVTI